MRFDKKYFIFSDALVFKNLENDKSLLAWVINIETGLQTDRVECKGHIQTLCESCFLEANSM